MSYAQWIFHYIEIMKNEKDKTEIDKAKIDIINNQIEFVGIMANPQLGLKILEEKGKKKTTDEISTGEYDLLKFMDDIAGMVPETIEVDMGNDKKNKFFLPKTNKKRKLGIEIKKDGVGE
jgi:hypothetical protein